MGVRKGSMGLQGWALVEPDYRAALGERKKINPIIGSAQPQPIKSRSGTADDADGRGPIPAFQVQTRIHRFHRLRADPPPA